mmetsp:Transcript_92535/g.146309  ORF Transcript_92535/g.146309 Transcript_92535/m.146309 type:complete len:249 (+) Transcript_92535:215-961(+)
MSCFLKIHFAARVGASACAKQQTASRRASASRTSNGHKSTGSKTECPCRCARIIAQSAINTVPSFISSPRCSTKYTARIRLQRLPNMGASLVDHALLVSLTASLPACSNKSAAQYLTSTSKWFIQRITKSSLESWPTLFTLSSSCATRCVKSFVSSRALQAIWPMPANIVECSNIEANNLYKTSFTTCGCMTSNCFRNLAAHISAVSRCLSKRHAPPSEISNAMCSSLRTFSTFKASFFKMHISSRRS